MLEIFGPTYRYQGEILTSPKVIYVNDHQYDEYQQCFHLATLLENSACDPQKHFLIFDHLGHDDVLQHYPNISLPLWLAGEVENFIDQNIQPDWSKKTHAFNFMINKPRLNREFLLYLIKHFELTDYCHSLAWKTINLSTRTMKSSMQSSLYIDIVDNTTVDIAVTDYRFGPEIAFDQGVLNGSYKNSATYQHLLQKTVFEPTCVSLITEPMFFERESMHTEKTVMAVYGGTFPIWVGGWRLADHFSSLGFDVFDDIIDHSYQTMSDPWDRCYYAVQRNLELLRNVDMGRELIQRNQARLAHNVQLCQDNVFQKYCMEKSQQQPPEVRQAVLNLVKSYCGGKIHYRKLHGYEVFGSTPVGTQYRSVLPNS